MTAALIVVTFLAVVSAARYYEEKEDMREMLDRLSRENRLLKETLRRD